MTNEIPTKPIDVSQLRHVNHLQLADSTFNVPGEIDIFLGADVLEDLMSDNRIKDNGVVVHEFFWTDCFWTCPKIRIGKQFSNFSQ